MTSLFQAKNSKDLHFGANLTELSYSSEDLVRIVSLRRKNNLKVRLKYIYLLNERLRNNSFNYRIGCSTHKILAQNNLPVTIKKNLQNIIEIFFC